MRFIFFLILCFSFFSTALSQTKKKAQKFFDEGNNSFRIGEFENAIEKYKKSLKLNPDFCESLYKLGLSYKNLNQFEKYEDILISYRDKQCLEFIDDVNFSLGKIYFYNGRIKMSLSSINKIIDTLKFSDYTILKKNIKFNLMSEENNLYEISITDTINNFVNQYSPFYSENDSILYFTVRKGNRLFDDENIFYSKVESFSINSDPMPFNILNSVNNEGSVSFSHIKMLANRSMMSMN